MNLSRTVNRTIPKGQVETQSISIPSQYNHLRLSMSRENWPAQVTVGLGVSDNGTDWKWFDNIIAAFIPTPKQPTVTDAVLEYAWNPAVVNRKQFVKVKTNSPSAFRTTVTVGAFVMTSP